MRVYIDRSNLLSFFGSYEHPNFEDALRMLKSQCDLYFNFSKEVVVSDEALRTIILQLTSGSKDSPKPKFSDVIFPERPLKSNFHTDLSDRNDLTAAYLLDDEKVSKIQDKGYLLVGGIGEEVDTLSKLFYEDYQFSKSFSPKRDMPHWNALQTTILPCTDIVLVDRYVFSDEILLDYNLHAYLSELGGKYQGKKIKIVIFTSLQQEGKGSDGKKFYFTPDWNAIKSGIKAYLQKAFNATSNVTIVALRRVEEHDRTIFVNYNNSYSGDSLNYYNSKWEVITNGRNYAVHSHGFRQHLVNGFYFIDDMQVILNNLSSQRDKECIYGDKKSNFLTFPD